MNTQERAIYLIERSFNGQLNAAEKAEMDEWLQQESNRDFYASQMSRIMLSDSSSVPYDERLWQPVLDNVLKVDKPGISRQAPRKAVMMRRYGWAAAAAVLVLLASGIVYRVANKTKHPAATAYSRLKDIAPGHNGAVLTLADGRVVELDSLQNGIVSTQNGTTIVLNNGSLAYEAGSNKEAAVLYNSISTPLARQFQLVLPDGTRVWLNAASSLRYPTVFAGKERRVEVTGEAYFEVAANTSQPFKVATTHYGEVAVLGTEFNINAYEEEAHAATTLVSGAVKVSAGSSALQLLPGQQAQVGNSQAIRLNTTPDVAQVTAWKNGVFNFENQKLEQVMRQLSRWYNLKVVYEKGVPDVQFFGEMGKNLNLSQVLLVLEGAGVRFRIEDNNTLVVMP